MYNIDTLAKKAGISRRTVRYYVQRELLPPPEGQNRGAYYTDEHLKVLKTINRLSEQGVPLIKMKAILNCEEEKRSGEEPLFNETYRSSRWERVEFMKGIEIQFYPNLLDDNELSQIKDFVENIIERRIKNEQPQ